MEKLTPFKAGIRYGLILALIGIVISLIVYYGGLQDYTNQNSGKNWILSLVTWVYVFAVMFLAIKAVKASNEGYLSIGEGMSTALYVGLVSGVIIAVWTYAFYSLIGTDMLDQIKEGIDLDEMSEAQAEATEKMMSIFMSPGLMSLMALLFRLISAGIFGLIASLIQKNEHSPYA